MIMGQTQVKTASEMLGLEMQDLVVPLTHKETVSTMIDKLFEIIRKQLFEASAYMTMGQILNLNPVNM